MEQQTEIIIKGYPYSIDAVNKVLVPQGDWQKPINYGDITIHNGMYDFYLCNDTKEILPLEGQEPHWWETRISLPSEVLDDPDGKSTSFLQKFNQISRVGILGYYLVDQHIRDRLNGIKPVIDMPDGRYEVHYGHECFLLKQGDEKKISLSIANYSFEPISLNFYYNSETKAYYPYFDKYFREDLLLIRIPPTIRLDPVGIARHDNACKKEGQRPLPETYYIDGFYEGNRMKSTVMKAIEVGKTEQLRPVNRKANRL